MDPASAVSAAVSSLAFLLQEVRRRKTPDDALHLRAALLDLEHALQGWVLEATETNWACEEWAEELPDSKGTAVEAVAYQVSSQWVGFQSVQEMFGGRIRTRQGDNADAATTLEDLLRVYAPEVLRLAPLLVDRQRQLRAGIGEELERRFRLGGRASVDEYIAELNAGRRGLEKFRRDLAAFIASEFPLDHLDARS